MSTFVLCVGCGEPLYGFSPCRWCTCERCENDLRDEFCSLCNSRNSFAYDPNMNSFDSPPDSYHPPHPTYETYSCESCGNDSHFGHDCLPRFPLNYEPEPGYNQNYNSYPHDSPSFPQQYPCCKGCGAKVLLLAWDRVSKIKDAFGNKQYKPEDIQELFRKLFNDVQNIHEELAKYINTLSWNRPAFYNNDEDDDVEFSIPMSEICKSALTASTPDLLITDSLIKEDEYLDTILETESNKLIKSSVENLVPNLSGSEGLSEDLSDIESECDVPVCDDLTTFSNLLFDADDNFSSSDDESFFDEDVPKEIYSNPLFDEEIISIKIDLHHFNAESDLIESLLNQDSSIISSPKIDSLLEEFSGELTHIDSIPPGINEADFDHEEEIRLVKKFLYDNSSPRPPEDPNSENSDGVIESFSPSHIPVMGSNSFMEEIDIFLALDDSIPPGIENDDYDS
nr:pre-mRNA splicing Prp18-interacting factor [Tanacetum cinerariifolium]